MNEQFLIDLEKQLTKSFPFGVPRHSIGDATGNILNRRSMANLDLTGQGIESRFKIGQKVIYPVAGLIEYMKNRTTVTEV